MRDYPRPAIDNRLALIFLAVAGYNIIILQYCMSKFKRIMIHYTLSLRTQLKEQTPRQR